MNWKGLICRRGDVLQKYTILKSDHFPGEQGAQQIKIAGSCIKGNNAPRVFTFAGCQNKKLLPLIDGAPNFRQVRSCPFVLSLPITHSCNDGGFRKLRPGSG